MLTQRFLGKRRVEDWGLACPPEFCGTKVWGVVAVFPSLIIASCKRMRSWFNCFWSDASIATLSGERVIVPVIVEYWVFRYFLVASSSIPVAGSFADVWSFLRARDVAGPKYVVSFPLDPGPVVDIV